MNNNFNFIILLGQKAKVKALYIEVQGVNNNNITTKYNIDYIVDFVRPVNEKLVKKLQLKI